MREHEPLAESARGWHARPMDWDAEEKAADSEEDRKGSAAPGSWPRWPSFHRSTQPGDARRGSPEEDLAGQERRPAASAD